MSPIVLFGEISREFCAKLYDIGCEMETAHMYLGKPWKSIMYHTSSFAMPTTGMCSPFKTNSGHCQSPHCFRCWWFMLRLAWGWREGKERRLESEREATFLYQTSVSSLPSWKSDYPAPQQQDLQRGPPVRVARAVSSEGEPRGQGETPPRSLFTISPLVPLQPEAPTDWDATSRFLPRELSLPSLVPMSLLPAFSGILLCMIQLSAHTQLLGTSIPTDFYNN